MYERVLIYEPFHLQPQTFSAVARNTTIHLFKDLKKQVSTNIKWFVWWLKKKKRNRTAALSLTITQGLSSRLNCTELMTKKNSTCFLWVAFSVHCRGVGWLVCLRVRVLLGVVSHTVTSCIYRRVKKKSLLLFLVAKICWQWLDFVHLTKY